MGPDEKRAGGCYAAPVMTQDAAGGAAPEPAAAGAAVAPGPEGVLDLLGLLAYGSLTGFFRLSDDAALAVALTDKMALAEMAVAEFGHFRLLRGRLGQLAADPDQAMAPFVGAIDDYHARTAPADWLESLVKAYVGDGIAADFYRVVAERLDPATRSLVEEVLADTGHAEFAVARVREATGSDPKLEGRLALWGRRLVGEALGQALRVAADRPPLARLLAGDATTQLGEVGRMFARLTDAHAQRMAALGLDGSLAAAAQPDSGALSRRRSRSGAIPSPQSRYRRACRQARAPGRPSHRSGSGPSRPRWRS